METPIWVRRLHGRSPLWASFQPRTFWPQCRGCLGCLRWVPGKLRGPALYNIVPREMRHYKNPIRVPSLLGCQLQHHTPQVNLKMILVILQAYMSCPSKANPYSKPNSPQGPIQGFGDHCPGFGGPWPLGSRSLRVFKMFHRLGLFSTFLLALCGLQAARHPTFMAASGCQLCLWMLGCCRRTSTRLP